MTEPIVWTDIEAGLAAWLGAIVTNVVFEGQRIPLQTYPYVSVSLLTSARKAGRDDLVQTVDLTRAKYIRVTPAVADNYLFEIGINSTIFSYRSGDNATESQITAGLKAAITAAGISTTDNHGTLDVSSSSVFFVLTDSRLSWANLDNGHELVTVAKGTRKVVYQLNFHNSEANLRADANAAGMALAEAAVSSLSKQSVIDQLWAAGLGIVNNEAVKKTDVVLNGEWVSRGTVEVSFNIATTSTEDNGYIDTATLNGNIDAVAISPVTLHS